jgi:ABC-2 type transport system permease protein
MTATSAMTARLQADTRRVVRAGREVLGGISLAVAAGEVYALLGGKALALGGAVLLLLAPLALGAAAAVRGGEALSVALALLGVYLLCLAAWAALTTLGAVLLPGRAAVLATLSALWIALTLVLPALAVSAVAAAGPPAGKLETDLALRAELRQAGDGHNVNDPAFDRMRAELLRQHGVERVEDLPMNFRGVVAACSEHKLTQVLDTHAERQHAAETLQARALARKGWFTPALAVSAAAQAVAGTDLVHHHRFLEQAEAVRYAFVQGLNRLHAALAHEARVRAFHAELRAFHHPRLFLQAPFDPAALDELPALAAHARGD